MRVTIAAVAILILTGCAGGSSGPASLNNAFSGPGAQGKPGVAAANNPASVGRSVASRVLTSLAIERVLGPSAQPQGALN